MQSQSEKEKQNNYVWFLAILVAIILLASACNTKHEVGKPYVQGSAQHCVTLIQHTQTKTKITEIYSTPDYDIIVVGGVITEIQ